MITSEHLGSDEGVNIQSMQSVMNLNWQYYMGTLITVEYP
jgi:hypothetical protein